MIQAITNAFPANTKNSSGNQMNKSRLRINDNAEPFSGNTDSKKHSLLRLCFLPKEGIMKKQQRVDKK